ncbi:hypothetical protein OH492_09205 [Vibrio chagasii]|nr:hypothetical protein [Vibrio chagasii]
MLCNHLNQQALLHASSIQDHHDFNTPLVLNSPTSTTIFRCHHCSRVKQWFESCRFWLPFGVATISQ